ncbi:uncharacterized protein LOC106069798 isoform X5 [Biomphalaria glabrata]|nr:uncharacterized protein LOC106069798 isoform X5 [Biomphalaria glabrata]XP_055894712.1 uncharacterized protein LOC106069798 isoform X5 [Biomphalaria glabrata]
MRPTKRRGESFNVGRLSSAGPDKNISSRGHSASSDPPWGNPSDPRRAYSHDNSGRYPDSQYSSGQSQWSKKYSAEINRRKSDGQNLSAGLSYSQQQHQQRQLLLSMKSSPNLAKSDGSEGAHESVISPKGTSYLSAKSSPNIFDEVGLHDADSRAHSLGMLRSSSDFSMKHGGSVGSSNRMYSQDYYNLDNTSRQHTRRSLPSHTLLHKYQPDYENVTLLGSELGSEKISEIIDIDEVTGRDSNPQTPDVKTSNPFGGASLPTRDPSSLKYIKVNQNHEKYPSWPVTKPSGASEETQPINTRAQSMTDNTNTSKEFPQKQRLAYTPGLRPLVEKNSPVAERKVEGRNTSDPGIKSEFVYDKVGRVVRRNNDAVENRFEDFYKNSQPGYPPPKMDPDGHNIGDKEYSAPSPPEREGKGLDSQDVSSRLTGSNDQSRYHWGHYNRPSSTQQPSSNTYLEGHISGSNVRPSNLNLNFDKKNVDTGTSPLDQGSPLNYRDVRSNSQGDTNYSLQLQQQQSRPRSWHDPFKGSPLQSWQEKNSPQENRQQSPSTPSSQASTRARQRDSYERPSPSGEKDVSKAYIVKSTPYYNTSTQTESVPYAIKLSNPAATSAKLRNAEIQVGEYGTQTSPKTPEDQKKMFEEKSIQARMSRDFQNTEVDKKLGAYYEGTKNNETMFNFLPSFNKSTFTDIQNIHAKYATDESPDMNANSEHHANSAPAFDHSVSLLRKLSEEFYGNKLDMTGDKRITSLQEQSPKFEISASSSSVLQQPGLREAESYSSVVIHHDETGSLFGREEYGSVSSIADSSRTENSYPFLDVSQKNDGGYTKGRRSLDPVFLNQKNRPQNMDLRSSGSGFHREMSSPAMSSYPSSTSNASTSKSYYAFPHSASGSDLSGISNRKSSSSDSRSSLGGTPFSSLTESSVSMNSNEQTLTTSLQSKAAPQSAPEDSKKKRNDSDSVFISADDDLSDYQFNRKPSLRKAYGIYDETERLISQSTSSSAKSVNKGKDPPRPSQDAGSASNVYVPMSRGMKFSESQTLGLIQEEGDNPNLHSDNSGVSSSLSSWSQSAGRQQEPPKYSWQSESWLKSQADLAKGTNLKRTISEQIPVVKHTAPAFSSYDTDSGQFRMTDKPNTVFPGPSPTSLDYKSSELNVGHLRTHSEDLSQLNEPNLRKLQQQALLSFIQRKTHAGGTHSRDFSTDSSMYESIEGNSSESVADIISKANENLAKSAQRVDSIRRSNSTSSRSSDYMEMTKYDRMRRETEWSKLRSSGSLRYGPDDERRSRSSFASENHYEDISIFSPSTRDSLAESVDISVDTRNSDASMDSGLVASPTYQNYQNKRRPPPPLPRSPSPDAPPALPPRMYKESELSSMDAKDQPQGQGDKARANTVPLGKQLEDPQVDSTKRDFRSLMSQWENSSPREDKYAAELRRQAQRLTGQQQLSAMPMTVLHTKPKINVATTYKREPTQPQEATSPSSSSLSSSSASSLPSSQTNIPAPSASPTSSSAHFQSSTNISSVKLQPRSDGASPATSASSVISAGNLTNMAPTSSLGKNLPPQTISSSPPPPQLPERTFFSEDSRHRSSSEVLQDNQLTNHSAVNHKPMLRERSASDHDVLSERRQQPQETYIGATPDGTPMAVTKYRQEQGSVVFSTSSQFKSGDNTYTEGHHVGFAEESYIGHKNKSSRAIGTYKRSKSAAVLQGNSNSVDEDDQKLGQQSWNSESVLTQDNPKQEEPGSALVESGQGAHLHNDRVEPIHEQNPLPAPVRPARPSTYGRNSSQTKPIPQVSQESSSGLPGNIHSGDYRHENPRTGAQQTSVEPVTSDQSHGTNKDTRWASPDNSRPAPGNIPLSQYSPQRRAPTNDSNHWSGQNNQATLPNSSQNIYFTKASEQEPAVPPRDYQRRESAPLRSAASTSGSDLLSVSADTPRRRSDSSVNTSRSDHSSSDLSTSGHSRQPSQEELECDQKAQQLAQNLADKDQKLSEVLRLDSTKKRMQYMDGLFSESMDGGPMDRTSFSSDTRSSLKNRNTLPNRSSSSSEAQEISKRGSLPKEYWMSPSKALLEMELRNNEEVTKDITKNINDNNSLVKQKEELLEKLHKKLHVLKDEKEMLQQEIAENDQLGKQVHQVIETKCQTQSEREKFKTYIDDLEKIVRLLLNLSGQLARAENAVQALAPDVDAKLRKLTVDKRERLHSKHEEAKLLKDDIDKRNEQLSLILRERLDEVEFADYNHYIKMKSKLTIDLQEMEDKITLGGEQIAELKKSIPDPGSGM